jgi:polyhydroxybutyrate depolymerase
MTRVRFRSLASLVLAMCVTSCGGSASMPSGNPSPGGVQHASINVDGLDRTYRLYVPPSLDLSQPAPLLVALACGGCTGDDMAKFTGYDELAAVDRFIVVYPDAVDESWNGGAGDPAIDDAFIGRLLDRLTTSYRIDKARIFAAGISSGAIMAYRLACEMADRFSGIASVAGMMLLAECHPARPVSILEMHGTADSTILLGEAGYPYTAADSVYRWASLDGCAAKPNQTVSGITKISTWVGCRGGTVVRLESVTGAPHEWLSPVNEVHGEPDATQVTWSFLSSSVPRT